MRILVLSSRIPYPLTAGFRIRIYNGAKYLKRGGNQVDLLFLGKKKEIEKYREELHAVFKNVYVIEQKKSEIIRNIIRGFFKVSLPFQVLLYQCNAFQKKLLEIEGQYDIVIGNHIRTSEYLKKLNPRKVVLDMHDAISYNYFNAKKITHGIRKLIYNVEYKRVLHYECAITSAFERIVIISNKDADWLKKHGADISRLSIIPVAVRDDIQNNKGDYEKDEMIISFLGKMSYQPNIDAMTWFCEAVMPLLAMKYPELKLYIMGIEPPDNIKVLEKSKNIIVTGFLNNPYEIVRKSIASVVPIRNGAGIQNKVLESMIVGTPVVASSIASEGIEAKNKEQILIADNENDYVECISELIESIDTRKRIGLNGKKYVEDNYSWSTLYAKWKRLLFEGAKK